MTTATVRPVPQSIENAMNALRDKYGSLYAAAKHMRVPLTTLSTYEKGRSLPDEAMAVRLADEIGVPRESMLALVAAERAERLNNHEIAGLWRKLAGAALVVFLAVQIALVVPLLIPQSNQAVAAEFSPTEIYIIRIIVVAILLILWCKFRRPNNQ